MKYDIHRQLKRGLDNAFREFLYDVKPQYKHVEQVGNSVIEQMQNCVEFSRAVLRQTPRPTAFFCSGMYEARALIYAALELGLRVPRDLSIVAVGYSEDAETTYPAVTFLGHDFVQQLTQAMLLLQRRVAGQDLEAQDILVDTKLEVRNTTGRCLEN